jgi:hypothetical protein
MSLANWLTHLAILQKLLHAVVYAVDILPVVIAWPRMFLQPYWVWRKILLQIRLVASVKFLLCRPVKQTTKLEPDHIESCDLKWLLAILHLQTS